MSTASIETSPSSQIWRGAGQNEHFVQFYEDDSTLLASLQGYLEHHLHRGAAAIVIATGAHLDALYSSASLMAWTWTPHSAPVSICR